uniref:Vomeronasal type-1 receptor n=1 Tax=Accipiter nisus TaxID=211598 RepID=A0A8B9NC14_9AVES
MAGLVNNLLILFLVFQNICLGFRSPLSVFKRYKDTTRSLSSECLGSNRPVISLGLSDFALDIRMPGVTPKQLTLSLMPAWTLSITCYFSDVMNPLLLKITGKSCNLLLLLWVEINGLSVILQVFSRSSREKR